MITIFTDSCNPLSPKKYDEMIFSLQLHQLSCPRCGRAGRMAFYGSYTRSVKQDGELVELRISRAVCGECGTTHALLPSGIVPYSRAMLEDQADIASGKPEAVMERNPLIDESCARSIIRRFKKHWEQPLLAAGAPFRPLRSLVLACFSFMNRQFMQIKRTPNILFQRPT